MMIGFGLICDQLKILFWLDEFCCEVFDDVKNINLLESLVNDYNGK